MKLGNFNGGYKILDFVKAVAYATGSASTETISGLYNRVKEALEDKSKPLVLHDLIIDVSGSQTLIGDTFIDRANAKVDASKAVFFIGVGSNNVKITVTSAGALNADVYEYAGGAGGVSDLDDLSDVALDNPANGQVLKYNSTTEKWENANESGGGGSADYQIIDVASETLWADLEALDLSKPVFIKRGAYCVPVVLASHYNVSAPYVFYFIDSNIFYNLTITNGNPVTVSTTVAERIESIVHTFTGGVVSAEAEIATGEFSGELSLYDYSSNQITTIDGLIISSQYLTAMFKLNETKQLHIPINTFVDTDAGVSGTVYVDIPITRVSDSIVQIGEGRFVADDAVIIPAPTLYNYKVLPNKTNFTVGEATPDALSFTVYREVTDDVYSTSEALTNKKWIDGKPVYRKVVSLGTLPNATAKEVDTGIDYATADNIMIGFCGATNGVSYTPVPFIDPGSQNKGIGAWIYKDATTQSVRVKMTTDADWSTYNGYVIVYFTKVTT